MARRSEHSLDQIKDMILSAAVHIIAEQGLQSLTVRKIALEIGYTVGSIYMVFENMQDLLLQVKAKTLQELTAQLTLNPQAGNEEAQILALAEAYFNFAKLNFNRWCIIFEPLSTDKQVLPDWYQEKIALVFFPIEELFQQLKPDAAPADARLAARSLWAGIHGVCVLAFQGSLSRVGVDDSLAAVHLLVKHFIRSWKSG